MQDFDPEKNWMCSRRNSGGDFQKSDSCVILPMICNYSSYQMYLRISKICIGDRIEKSLQQTGVSTVFPPRTGVSRTY